MMEGVLFDMDGVLIKSEEIYYRVVRETFNKFGVQIGEEEYVRRWILEQTESRGVIKDYGLKVSLEDLRTIMSALLDKAIEKELEVMPGARELVGRLKRDYPLGIVSSETREYIPKKLRKFYSLNHFRVIVGAEDVTRKKPNPEPYRKGCDLLRIYPGRVLVIEDNPSGVKSAKSAGCRAIAYPNGFTADLNFQHADARVDSLHEITPELINSLFL